MGGNGNGKGAKGGKGGKGNGGKGGKSGAPRPPAEQIELQPVKMTLRVKRGDASEPVGMKVSPTMDVTQVTPGSPASLAGLVRTMRIEEVCGTPVSSPAEMKAAGADTPCDMALVVAVDSSARLRGTVASWSSDRGFGSLFPDVPVFVQAGVLGGSKGGTAMYTGNIFCHNAAISNGPRSLALDQEVEFSVKAVGGKLKCFTVTGVGRPLQPYVEAGGAAPTGGRKPRVGADISAHAQGEFICMMHFGGVCSPGRRCGKGLHLDNPYKAELEEKKKKKDTGAVEKVAEVQWLNKNNLGEENIVAFTSGPTDGSMKYAKSGVERPPFTRFVYHPDTAVLEMPEIQKQVRIPYGSGRDVLKEVRLLAEQCGVTHNIQNTQQDGKEFDFAQDTLSRVGPAKLKLLQKQVAEASGGGVAACEAWQLRNDAIEFRFRATEYNMTQVEMKAPDMIDGFHGTAEQSVLSIAQSGFDPLRRSGQVFGEGEYFARNPCVSVGYCRGGGFMFVCKLILGTADVDHTWVSDMGYYVIKQRNGNVQCLPQYLIRFQDKGHTPLYRALSAFASDEKAGEESMRRLGEGQRGGVKPCKGRIDGCMMAKSTSHIWLGWLDPSLGGDDAALHADLCAFLSGYTVKKVHVDRNGARFGAFVELEQCVNRAQLAELNMRPYGKGAHRISVDDAQPGNPYMKLTRCPKLHGPGKYCRGWNLRGHHSWFETCSFLHDESAFIHSGARVQYEEVPSGSAKYHELEQGMRGVGRVLGIRRVINTTQEETYESRRSFLNTKHGNVSEMELWHGTACSVLDTVLQRGLQSPADSCPSDACPLSGGKGLSTTLCGTDCELCTEHHKWNMCHMFGHGIYLADDAAKSHRYVRPHGGTHSLVRCRVNLGNPFLIESNLKQRDAMHDITWCVDPSEHLEEAPHVWDTLKGHESYYVKGLGPRAKPGMGVINSEYIVFHPSQVLPLYIVDYIPGSSAP